MNLKPVTDPRVGQRLLCYRCGKWGLAFSMYADLDGPAYVAYYHTDCASSAATESLKKTLNQGS